MSPMKLVFRRSYATMAKKRTKTRDVHAKLFFLLTIVPLYAVDAIALTVV